MSTLKSAQRFAAAPQVQLVHKGLLLDHATSKTLTTYSLPHTHTQTHILTTMPGAATTTA